MEGSGLAVSAQKGGTKCEEGVLLAAVLLGLAAVPAAGAQPVSLEARFHESAGRAVAHPCDPPAFACGSGELEGFGAATSTFEVLTFTNFDPETSCGDATVRYTITLTSGAGTLVLTETGVVCFPGKSTLAPGATKSFGNPPRGDVVLARLVVFLGDIALDRAVMRVSSSARSSLSRFHHALSLRRMPIRNPRTDRERGSQLRASTVPSLSSG